MASNPQAISSMYPDGFIVGFHGVLDNRAAEQIALALTSAVRDGFKQISLCFSCVGGGLPNAYYLRTVLQGLPVPLTIFAAGVIQSSANLIFLAGSTRIATPDARFWFHEASTTPDEQLKERDLLSRLEGVRHDNARTSAYIAERTGRAGAEVRQWFTEECGFGPEEAIKFGIAHKVGQFEIPKRAFFHQLVTPWQQVK